MPCIRLLGGLGNQLFQVAAGEVIRQETNLSVAFDRSWFAHRAPGAHPREFEVARLLGDCTVVRLPKAVERLAYSRRNPWLVVERGPDDDLLAQPMSRHAFVHGYFQFSRYPMLVRDRLESMFQSQSEMGLQPALVGAIGVHVRLGDYYHDSNTRRHHGVLSPAYFAEAVRRVRALGHDGPVVVFTDSPDVFATEYQPYLGVDSTLAKTETAWDTMAAMASCSSLVISNSSLSWWAAFVAADPFGSSGVVIRPQPWFSKPSAADQNLSVDGWQPLDREW